MDRRAPWASLAAVSIVIAAVSIGALAFERFLFAFRILGPPPDPTIVQTLTYWVTAVAAVGIQVTGLLGAIRDERAISATVFTLLAVGVTVAALLLSGAAASSRTGQPPEPRSTYTPCFSGSTLPCPGG